MYDDALTNYTLLSLADGALAVESAMFGRDTLYSIEAFWFNGSQTWYSVEDAIDAIGIRVTASVEGGYRSGGDGADIFVGSTGDDDFYGGLGDDVYFGGAGFDQVFFDGALTDLALVANADGSVQASGPGGQTDLFSSIEGLWFDGERCRLVQFPGVDGRQPERGRRRF